MGSAISGSVCSLVLRQGPAFTLGLAVAFVLSAETRPAQGSSFVSHCVEMATWDELQRPESEGLAERLEGQLEEALTQEIAPGISTSLKQYTVISYVESVLDVVRSKDYGHKGLAEFLAIQKRVARDRDLQAVLGDVGTKNVKSYTQRMELAEHAENLVTTYNERMNQPRVTEAMRKAGDGNATWPALFQLSDRALIGDIERTAESLFRDFNVKVTQGKTRAGHRMWVILPVDQAPGIFVHPLNRLAERLANDSRALVGDRGLSTTLSFSPEELFELGFMGANFGDENRISLGLESVMDLNLDDVGGHEIIHGQEDSFVDRGLRSPYAGKLAAEGTRVPLGGDAAGGYSAYMHLSELRAFAYTLSVRALRLRRLTGLSMGSLTAKRSAESYGRIVSVFMKITGQTLETGKSALAILEQEIKAPLPSGNVRFSVEARAGEINFLRVQVRVPQEGGGVHIWERQLKVSSELLYRASQDPSYVASRGGTVPARTSMLRASREGLLNVAQADLTSWVAEAGKFDQEATALMGSLTYWRTHLQDPNAFEAFYTAALALRTHARFLGHEARKLSYEPLGAPKAEPRATVRILAETQEDQEMVSGWKKFWHGIFGSRDRK